MLDWLTLIPPVALAVGAAACLTTPAAWRSRQAAVVLGAVVVAVIVPLALLAALQVSGIESLHVALSPWSSAVFQDDPAFDVDRLAAVCIGCLCLVVLAGLVRAMAESSRLDSQAGPLFVAAAGVVFIAAARTPLGLVSSWLLMDVALFFAGRIKRRGLLASHVGLLMVLAALIELPLGTRLLQSGALTPSSRVLLLAAAAIRMGLYPLWWPVPRSRTTMAWQASAIRLAPTAAGAFLALVASGGAQAAPAPSLAALAPGLLAVVGGALVSWLSSAPLAAMDWTTTFAGGLIVLAAGTGGAVGQSAAIVLFLALLLECGVPYIAHGLAPGRAAIDARVAAVAGVLGIPPTLGFVGRMLLFGQLLRHGETGALLLVAGATALTTARWRHAVARPTDAPPPRAPLAGMLLVLTGLDVALGIGYVLARAGLEDVLRMPLPPVLPAATGRAAVVGGAILLPLLAGMFLPSRPWSLWPVSTSRREATLRLVGLTEAFDGVRTLLIRLGRIVHNSVGLIEGRGMMAWTLLAALVTGAVLLESPVPAAGAGAPAPGWQAFAPLALAMIVAAGMLLAASPLATLAALVVGYVLVFIMHLSLAAFAAADPLVATAMIQLVAGLVVVAILAISVLQGPSDRRRGHGSPRWRSLGVAQGPAVERRLPAVGLAVALLGITGISSAAQPLTLPETVLQPALALIAGGALTAVFARTPLRLTGGVMLAWCGFGLVYARLETGLLIGGGLAAFQLLFAIVSSAFVALSSRPEAGR